MNGIMSSSANILLFVLVQCISACSWLVQGVRILKHMKQQRNKVHAPKH